MAVEAKHLSIFSPQPQFITNRDVVSGNERYIHNSTAQAGYGGGVAGTSPESLIALPRSLICESVAMKAECDSGVTYNVPNSAQRKRSRDNSLTIMEEQMEMANSVFLLHQQNDAPSHHHMSFLGDEDIALQIHQHQSEIDYILAQHTKKMRLQVEERQKQQARMLVWAIGEGVRKKMKEKEEEIQRMGKLNWFLQERVKSLYMENQFWREIASANEATANSLRINLEQLLASAAAAEAAHVSEDQRARGEDKNDAESCCGSSDHGDGRGREREGEEREGMRMCKRCGERESGVVLLPCRHLCLCTICGSSLPDSCPVCHSYMNATLHVNLSSSS